MNTSPSPNDKSTVEYWSEFWKSHGLPAPVNIDVKDLKSYSQRKFHEFFERNLAPLKNQNKSIIEIGCGNSIWLTYFNRQFGFEVSGIDYSEFGCEQTKKILERDKVNGEVILGDLFNPPAELAGHYDIACSFGVIEHFNDTEDVIRRISGFVKPGGIILTVIPNLVGLTGFLQKTMNKPVYDIHKPMTLSDLEKFTKNAGLEIIDKELLLPIAFGVTLDENEGKKVRFLPFKKLFLKGLQVVEKVAWLVDDKLFALPKNEIFCAGMMIAARKK